MGHEIKNMDLLSELSDLKGCLMLGIVDILLKYPNSYSGTALKKLPATRIKKIGCVPDRVRRINNENNPLLIFN